jgi:hypothetical protein
LESPAQIYLASKEVYGMEEEIGKSGLSLSRKIQLKEPLTIQEEISFSIDKYELKQTQITDLLTRDYYLDVLEASQVRTPQERMHYRTIVECMKNDVDKSLRARCEELLNRRRCGNALLEEDVECSTIQQPINSTDLED